MGSTSCCTLNFVKLNLYRLRALYHRNGLKSHTISLENGTTIHCWVQVDKENLKHTPRTTHKAPSRSSGGLQHAVRERHRWLMEEGSRRLSFRTRGSSRGHSSMPPHIPQGMHPGIPPSIPPNMPPGVPPGMPPGVPHGMPPGVLPGVPPGHPSRVPLHGSRRERGRPGMPFDETMHERASSIPVRDRPVLVLLHGFGGNGTVAWEHQVSMFSKDYRLIIPDLVFFGTSTTSNTQRTEIFQADCIVDLLTHLDIEAAHVVGTSYGGFVAFWMAYKYPHRCRKLVLASSGICMTPRTNDALLDACKLDSINDLMLPTTVDGLKLSLSLIFAKRPPFPDFLVQQILDVLYAHEDRPRRVELLDALVIGSEKCPPLPSLQQRVLIVWGRSDQIFKLNLAYELQRHLGPSSNVAVIEGAGHLPQQEKPKEFNSIVTNFLS